MFTLCHIIITESSPAAKVLPVDTAFQNIAKFSAEGWILRFCTLFWAKLSCFIIHTILRTTIYKPRTETAKSFIFSNRGDTQKAEQEDGSRLLKHRKIGRVQKIKMLFSTRNNSVAVLKCTALYCVSSPAWSPSMLEMTRGKVSRVRRLPSPRPGSSSLATLGVGRMEVAAGSGETEVTEDRGCE